MLRQYHTIILLGERISPKEGEKVLDDLVQFIKNRGVKEVRLHPMGRRPLAYPIQKNRMAEYVILEYEAEGEVVNAFTQELRVHPEVIRFGTFQGKAEYDPKELHHLNFHLLSQFITERGKIRPARTTRFLARDQRKLARMIKRARILGFLPFTTLSQG
jgi:small subunit ribosomal protein S18